MTCFNRFRGDISKKIQIPKSSENIIQLVQNAHQQMLSHKDIVVTTPLQKHSQYSKKYNCNLYFKREDMQTVRSFKIRGAFNKIFNLEQYEKDAGIVCASAGNHAQGFAHTCNKLKIYGDIFLPQQTPFQKVNRIKYFANGFCNINLIGTDFNECLHHSLQFCEQHQKTFIHPYDDFQTIIGQATIANEIYNQIDPDIIVGSIGGGGLMAGISMFGKSHSSSSCLMIGAEPEYCPSMKISIEQNNLVEIPINDTFVDGATVSKVGEITFKFCKHYLDDIYTSHVGRICQEMLELYQNDGIVLEPAGALSLSVLDKIDRSILEGKNVVCILSGGNNDITRYPDVLEKYLLYQNLKHYYIIKFPQTPGQLSKFINHVLGVGDDIVRFDYLKKTNKEYGNVLIGIQVQHIENVHKIDQNLKKYHFDFIKINENDLLYSYLV